MIVLFSLKWRKRKAVFWNMGFIKWAERNGEISQLSWKPFSPQNIKSVKILIIYALCLVFHYESAVYLKGTPYNTLQSLL